MPERVNDLTSRVSFSNPPLLLLFVFWFVLLSLLSSRFPTSWDLRIGMHVRTRWTSHSATAKLDETEIRWLVAHERPARPTKRGSSRLLFGQSTRLEVQRLLLAAAYPAACHGDPIHPTPTKQLPRMAFVKSVCRLWPALSRPPNPIRDHNTLSRAQTDDPWLHGSSAACTPTDHGDARRVPLASDSVPIASPLSPSVGFHPCCSVPAAGPCPKCG